MDDDYELMQRAIAGDKEAARMYCGSYTLIRPRDSVLLYRCKGDVPDGFVKMETNHGVSVYDEDGFLLPQYWSLQIIYG